MGGTPCKCATKCSILGLRLWNSSLTILFHTLTRNWQDLLRWPIQFPHFNHSYEGAKLSSKNAALFFTCSCTETQSQEQTLHSTGDLFDFWYPLAHERQVAKAKEQIEKISNRKTGRNKKHAHFHTIAHRNWLEVWSCDILCFPFWTKVLIFFWKAIIVFLFLLLASIWTEGQKTPHWSLQGWCQDILWMQHATMFPKSVGPLPGRPV